MYRERISNENKRFTRVHPYESDGDEWIDDPDASFVSTQRPQRGTRPAYIESEFRQRENEERVLMELVNAKNYRRGDTTFHHEPSRVIPFTPHHFTITPDNPFYPI